MSRQILRFGSLLEHLDCLLQKLRLLPIEDQVHLLRPLCRKSFCYVSVAARPPLMAATKKRDAIQAYKQSNRMATVNACGLFIDEEENWLCGTPDSIVVSGELCGCLEVKCPLVCADQPVSAAAKGKVILPRKVW